ncbi:structural protein [Saccharopolyspora pogona]|uniref:hypothetical protein n=1 Tax=Saccharopolyspora pogona TaxID=333966 RepID=UPI0016871EF1|nr:hypothetical protein [Saccharopolyspora pogona]
MTAPTTEQQPPDGQALEDAAIVAGLAVLLASAATVPPLAAIVALLMRPPKQRGEPKVSRTAATVAARLVLQQRQPPATPTGAAGRQMQRLNIQRRAQFLLAAARRITRQIGTNRSKEAVVKALQAERRYWQQHVEASAKRERAASLVDSTAEREGVRQPATPGGKVGTVVGWHATLDDRTDPDCRAAHGKNFIVERPPRIGLPGAVHPACRCVPVRAYRTRHLVGGGQLPNLPR